MPWLLGAAKLLFVLQAADPTVLGTIVDAAADSALVGAVVSLPDLARSAVTDAHGRYAFPSVPSGPQRIVVTHMGYAPRTLEAIVPSAGSIVINFALHAEPFRLPSIEVWLPAPLSDPNAPDSTPYPDRGLSLGAIRNDPLLSEPDAFLALGGAEVELNPESPSGIHVRGGASDQTGYALDGVPILSPYHAAGTFSAWNPDALERVQLSSSSPSLAFPDVLSGTVAGVTRTPASHARAQGSVSTTQARATVDGPVGVAGAAFLLSYRSGMPGVVAPRNDPSYLTGVATDVLATFEAPTLGGRLRLLGYDNANEIGAASAALGADSSASAPVRNRFHWRSRSLGVEWSGHIDGLVVRALGWSATSEAGAGWAVEGAPSVDLASRRGDGGVAATIETSDAAATSAAGVRIQRSRTSYRVTPVADGGPALALDAATPVATLFFRHERRLGRRVVADVGLAAGWAAGNVRVAPRAALRWAATRSLTVTGSYTRTHQYLQSLRNPESVVGNIFPADLWIGAGTAGIPVARSDQGIAAAEYRPRSGVRLGGQVYLRRSDGLVLVAPTTGKPFATSAVTTGSGSTHGASLDATVDGSRIGFVASYGWEHVRLDHDGVSYVPVHAVSHRLEAGVIVFPSAGSSIRLGATGAFGRRTTAVASPFEWEACNLLDRGCELGGSPEYRTGDLGATRLPAYLRLDLGIRKQWRLRAGGRDASVAFFGTVTNLLGRRNLLTTAPNSITGQPVGIEMRPFGPLVVGLDWQF